MLPHPSPSPAGNRFIPYEEIVTAVRARKFPVKYELTLHSGEQLGLRWGTETGELGEGGDLLAKALENATSH